ncbi:DUF3050 domain-containing protein [Microvirga sp. STR05]|uniref:DUF3050 domain-containing protein n=1 Tax=Hymenobacter duratus TaxID=2771356 RepID=A0ABR8JKA4_9BACT|nr:DUF3050 domain-containing protein [Hymenobacter duratus]MBD2715810.1 DUF3050 domain-containing protein [Hymenobacter duratus]MBR7950721.1 DUF3050 domain-containing protein [Microvirga sp. STR05]
MSTSVHPDSIAELQQALAPAREQLVAHGVYQSLHSLHDLRVFMEHHVFAVWDFMSLLKALQRELTCVEVPWVPRGNPATRRLINDIVLEEETDVDPEGRPASHFELYLRAMRECGADTAPIEKLLAALAAGATVGQALEQAQAPASVQKFVLATFRIIDSGKPHTVAAAFTFGREDVIPDMFRHLVADLTQRFPGQLDTFSYYLNRHIQLDEEVHTPLAQQMVRDLCGDDAQRWQESREVAVGCMQARIALWDGIRAALTQSAVL